MFFRKREPEFRGYLDRLQDGVISGWLQDRQHPKRRYSIELFYAGEAFAIVETNVYRHDLKLAGIGDGIYGFTCNCQPDIKNIEAIAAKVKDQDFWLFNDLPGSSLKVNLKSLNNKPRRGLPILYTGLSQRNIEEEDVKIAEEIFSIWQSIKPLDRSNQKFTGSMWSHIIGERFSKFLLLLDQRNPLELATYLVNIHKHPESSGLFQGDRAYKDFLSASPEGRRAAITPFQDMLASLAQYLSVLPLDCEEQGELGGPIATPPEELIMLIEDKLGYEILPKQLYDGLYGLAINGKILHGRDIQALYLALRQTEVLAKKCADICEIGAGFGMAAYYAWLLGCKRYFIIDLPEVCILQYFTLRRLLPDIRISVVNKDNLLNIDCDICIIPTQFIEKFSINKLDLIVNVDSLPEMGQEICRYYLNKIPQWSSLLLSINQEANRKIDDEINRQVILSEMLSNQEYRRLYRFRSWIRQGYAEELWQTPKNSEATLKNVICNDT